ncbi:MAG: response regulator [Candidatus Sigynarchaeota archaeon]
MAGVVSQAVMDVMMPGIDGIEAIKRIKGMKPGVKVILMTAHASSATDVAANEEGAAAMLYKPVDLDRIAALLRTG